MALNYLKINQSISSRVKSYLNMNTDYDSEIKNLNTNTTNGIEGLPYQFMDTVDRRIPGTEVGRKYGEKVFSHLPLLFLTPCNPLFMGDFNNNDAINAAESLINIATGGDAALGVNSSGKYYTMEFAYDEYWNYVNLMLRTVANYMFPDDMPKINGTPLNKYNAQSESNEAFNTFFSGAENAIFYLDSYTSVDESYSNSTGESALASTINQYSAMANEIRFLFGDKGNVAANLLSAGSEVTEAIGASLSSVASSLAGGIVGSLSNKGVKSVLNGGKIIFPKIWQDSQAGTDKSFTFNIKLRSPDHDNLSIYLNILKPYIKILALVLPRQVDSTDPNSYKAPFLVRTSVKGMAYADMGLITAMSVTKGDNCQWNDDGLPTQIDISITVEELYGALAMSSLYDNPINIANNTSYMDFLANTAGVNISQLDIGQRVKRFYDVVTSVLDVKSLGSSARTTFDRFVSNVSGRLYNLL
jgi:hypothetical protein